jgi:DNA processing protein
MIETMPTLYDLLYLSTIPNIGPGRIRRLFTVFQNVEQILKAPVQKLVKVEGIDYRLADLIKAGGQPAVAQNQVALIKKLHIDYVTIWDKDYPNLLKRISDAPVILFYKGNIQAQHERSIAVVGTRTPSIYGKIITREIVRQLVSHDFTIVSGLARGVDSIAHHTTLQSNGQTIAVLGCGIDLCYPPENRPLYQQIQKQGYIVSEYLVGTGPDAMNFPRRNRIISGLSLGTLVVEAGEKSGAIISALFALNQNREVFAIPGNINNPRSRGCNKLIKEGAKLVQSVDDILEEIGEISSVKPTQPKPLPDNLSELEKRMLEKLSDDPMHIDHLVMVLKETPSTVLSSLLTLELMGLVQQLAGKMFIRI